MKIWPPTPGTYAMSLVRGGVLVPVRIWFGAAVIGGETQDRSHDWRCEIDGRTDRWEIDEATGYRCRVAIEVDRAWPFCAKRPISAWEYAYMIATTMWAHDHSPDHPKASPWRPVNFHSLPMRF